MIGWALSPTMPAELVCNALNLAIYERQPPPSIIVHSDRGSQYALIGSISRKGNCWDNSVMERFFLNLEMERVWRQNYTNNEETKINITDYITNFLNSRRIHSTLGYVSPNVYEVKNTVKEPIRVSYQT